MMLLSQIKAKFRRLVFLEKSPEVGELILKQRRVFTLPSKAGLLFCGMLIILFLTSTNYNLNLGFGMTYLLIGVAIVSVFFTFRNLAYLRLNATAGAPVFAGESAQFSLHINNPHTLERFAIHVGFLEKGHVDQIIDVSKQDRLTIQLAYPSAHRGYLPIRRIRFQTWFPLGLLRAWSTWLPDTKVLVYPTPETFPPPLPYIGETQNEGVRSIGDEDFSGVRNYHLGDPLKHLSWKHIERVDLDAGGNLVSKQFSGGSAGDLLIDFDSLPTNFDLELRLSRMTSWVLEADRLGLAYAFKIGVIHYRAAATESHRHACLSALALFNVVEYDAKGEHAQRP
jgi:uncharacterized protein (DUF58 family)